MSDHDLLLAAILNDPDDDLARLAYADWCDEEGRRERAEFVRAQMRLAALHSAACARCGEQTDFYKYTPFCRGDTCKLRIREYYSGRRYTAWDWRAGIPPGLFTRYTRGFVGEIHAPLDYLASAALAGVCNAHPIVSVVVSDRRPFRTADPAFGWYNWSVYDDPDALVSGEDLPDELYESLEGGQRDDHWRWYESEAGARAALSLVLVNRARAAARLPPLVRMERLITGAPPRAQADPKES